MKDTNKAANHIISHEVVNWKDDINDIFEEDKAQTTFEYKETSKTGQVKKVDDKSLLHVLIYYEICKNYLN